MAATRRVMAHVGSSLASLAALAIGLGQLADRPIVGVLLTLGGMALSLYGVARLCGADPFRG